MIVYLLAFSVAASTCRTNDAPVCDNLKVYDNLCEAEAANVTTAGTVCFSESVGPNSTSLYCSTSCGTVDIFEGLTKLCYTSLTPICADFNGMKIYSNPCSAERAKAVVRTDLKVCVSGRDLSCNTTCETMTDTIYAGRRRLKRRGGSLRSKSKKKKKLGAAATVLGGLSLASSARRRRRRRRREEEERRRPTCTCGRIYAPVCGEDSHVYNNDCLLTCSSENVTRSTTLKPCRRPDSTRECLEVCPEGDEQDTASADDQDPASEHDQETAAREDAAKGEDEQDKVGEDAADNSECEAVYAPVCTFGAQGIFLNRCLAYIANATVSTMTPCLEGATIICRRECKEDSKSAELLQLASRGVASHMSIFALFLLF